MKVTDYRKRVDHSDSLTDNKEPEKVEKMVSSINQVLEEFGIQSTAIWR